MSDLPSGYDSWRTSGQTRAYLVSRAEEMIGTKLIYNGNLAMVTNYREEGLASDEAELVYELTVYPVEQVEEVASNREITEGELEGLLYPYTFKLDMDEQACLGDALNMHRRHIESDDFAARAEQRHWVASQSRLEKKMRKILNARIFLDGEHR